MRLSRSSQIRVIVGWIQPVLATCFWIISISSELYFGNFYHQSFYCHVLQDTWKFAKHSSSHFQAGFAAGQCWKIPWNFMCRVSFCCCIWLGLQACWTDITDSARHFFSFVVFVANYILITPRWCSGKDVLVCCLHVAFYDLISTNSSVCVPKSSSTTRGTLTLCLSSR